ncbi:MAG: DUF523 and DUF1722 domain-containing protein [Deltaproteobacteria bacterium]|nr:DUF523 and DUF1722 domain-containing protein [Deltaproteobacteria bacterium]
MTTRLRIGISSCLLGHRVRYDGGHKRDHYLTDTLGRFVEFVPVCPEVECGLGVPREPMRLEGSPGSPRLVTARSRIDLTARMVSWAQEKVRQLEREGLCGFIFKSKSPSSGMQGVKIYNDRGVVYKRGTGIFAGIFIEHFPLVPVEDEARLHGMGIRENFIQRIFALKRWRELLADRPGRQELLSFHARERLAILSHSARHYRLMEKLTAENGKLPRGELYSKYESLFLQALQLKTTVKKNVKVLRHILAYLEKELTGNEKQELVEVIEQYEQEFIPLIVPLTISKHYVQKYGQQHLLEQVYLNPQPLETRLTNHV